MVLSSVDSNSSLHKLKCLLSNDQKSMNKPFTWLRASTACMGMCFKVCVSAPSQSHLPVQENEIM